MDVRPLGGPPSMTETKQPSLRTNGSKPKPSAKSTIAHNVDSPETSRESRRTGFPLSDNYTGLVNSLNQGVPDYALDDERKPKRPKLKLKSNNKPTNTANNAETFKQKTQSNSDTRSEKTETPSVIVDVDIAEYIAPKSQSAKNSQAADANYSSESSVDLNLFDDETLGKHHSDGANPVKPASGSNLGDDTIDIELAEMWKETFRDDVVSDVEAPQETKLKKPKVKLRSPERSPESSPMVSSADSQFDASEQALIAKAKSEMIATARARAVEAEAERVNAAKNDARRSIATRAERKRAKRARSEAKRTAAIRSESQRVQSLQREAAQANIARKAAQDAAQEEQRHLQAVKAEAEQAKLAEAALAREKATQREAVRVKAAQQEAAKSLAIRAEAKRLKEEQARVAEEQAKIARVKAVRAEMARARAAAADSVSSKAKAAKARAIKVEANRAKAAQVEAARLKAEQAEAAKSQAKQAEIARTQAARLEAERTERLAREQAKEKARAAASLEVERLNAVNLASKIKAVQSSSNAENSSRAAEVVLEPATSPKLKSMPSLVEEVDVVWLDETSEITSVDIVLPPNTGQSLRDDDTWSEDIYALDETSSAPLVVDSDDYLNQSMEYMAAIQEEDFDDTAGFNVPAASFSTGGKKRGWILRTMGSIQKMLTRVVSKSQRWMRSRKSRKN